MRNINNRVLCILMCLIIHFGIMPNQYIANAATQDVSNFVFDDAVQLLSSLGIENSDSNEYVTKSVFAKYIVSAIKGNPESVNINYYKDTAIGDAANYLASIGVLDIPENRMFCPDELITNDEVVKTFINIICSGYSLSMSGRKDIDYVRLAREIKLLNYYNPNAHLTYKELTTLIYNALMVDSKSISTISTDFMTTYENDESLLYKIHGVKWVEDIVTANSFASVYEDVQPSGENTIRVGVMCFKYSGEKEEFLLGQYVRAYYTVETNEIVHITYDSRYNNNIEIMAEDIVSYSDEALTYRDNDKIKTLRLTTPLLIKNGESKFIAGTEDVRQTIKTPRSKIRVSKKRNDDKYWIINVSTFENGKVTSVNGAEGIVYADFYGVTKKIHVQPSNGVFAQAYRLSNESKIVVSELKIGDIITCAVSDNGKIFKTYLCDKTVQGKVSAYEESQYGRKYYIDEGFYYQDIMPISSGEIVLGSQYAFVLDVFDRIVSFESLDDAFVLAYVYDRSDVNKRLKKEYEYAIYTENSKHLVVKAKKKMKLNKVSTKAEDLDSFLAPGGILNKQLIRIRYNKELEIVEIETAKTATLGDEITELSCVAPEKYRKVKKLSDSGHFMILPAADETDVIGYPYKANTKVFCIPKGNNYEDDDFVISNVKDYFGNNHTSYASLYCFDDDMFVDVMLYDFDLYENKPELKDETYVVNKSFFKIGKDDDFHLTLETLDSSGNIKLLQFQDEIYVARPDASGNVENYTLVSSHELSSILNQGDIIQTGTTSIGYRKYIRVLYDNKDKEAIWWGNQYSAESQPLSEYKSEDTGTRARFVYGYVGKVGYTRSGTAYVYVYNLETDEWIETISLEGNKRLYDSTCEYSSLLFETAREISSAEITGDKNLATRLFIIHTGQSSTDIIMYNN